MEKKNKSTRKSNAAETDKIQQAYRSHILENDKKPSSVFMFCKSNGFKEEHFYQHYASFEAIEKEIWRGYIQVTITRLGADSNYTSFSIRERILAFYFTLADVLKSDRSFVLKGLKDWSNPAIVPGFLKAFKTAFDAWLTPILNEGKQTGEIAKRPLLDNRYDSLLWLHLLFIIQFWSHDDSVGFEKTDVAIEKSVNLAFDLIGKGVLDNALDFGKFLYQNSKN